MSRKLIVNTRPAGKDDEFDRLLKENGMCVTDIPFISIRPVKDISVIDEKIQKLKSYDAIFFTSSNAVKIFFDRLEQLSVKYTGKIYAVGSRTKKTTESYGYTVSFMPDKYSSSELIDSLGDENIRGKRFLFPSGNISMKTIVNGLQDIADVDEAVIYETTKPEDTGRADKLKELIENNAVDCIAFFSPSAVDNFKELLKETDLRKLDFAVIGKTTLQRAEKYELNVKIIPENASAEALAEAIIKYYKI